MSDVFSPEPAPSDAAHNAAHDAAHNAAKTAVEVELMVRTTCGSCERVRQQIAPVLAQLGARLTVRTVDGDAELSAEFGDRVPVVVINGEEFACWEVDNDELAEEITAQAAQTA